MAKFQLFKPFRTELLSKDTKRILHLNFFKEEIDAVDLSNFLNGREFSGVFRNQTANCILQLKHYSCTRNCQLQRVLQYIDAEEYAQNPMKCAFVIYSFGNCCCCLYLFYGFALPIQYLHTLLPTNKCCISLCRFCPYSFVVDFTQKLTKDKSITKVKTLKYNIIFR